MSNNFITQDRICYATMTDIQEQACKIGVCPICGGRLDLPLITQDMQYYKCVSCHDIWVLRTD